ncbi:MAG: ribonuclease HII [Deltaproteobacteria bacterium]|nr:MAG: ribonuclease HII [Deltaproteobacteria bacterium]HEX16012.1 ribonuclease HII [Deltaproteobacteria bacterium]
MALGPRCPEGCEGRQWCERGLVAGVDEAGRGPLAGPVVAAAVILEGEHLLPEIKDSKQLRASEREALYKFITSHALSWAVAVVGPREIERLDILRASLEAMSRAVSKLEVVPSAVLVDGPHPIDDLSLPQRPMVKGDALCPMIAAASIVAKVTRDRIMMEYHRIYPQYGFSRHKGYPTREHREALRRYGPSPIHRRNFRLL